MFNEFLS